ncbi:MAG TPA: hypothetical protein VLJ88_04690 [Propionibacteriaceae bacterium]|nr:hypothetical protein [Propionibacteriaceae bacterium]
MMRYAQAVLAGSAPGRSALDPRADSSNGLIGLAWQLSVLILLAHGPWRVVPGWLWGRWPD